MKTQVSQKFWGYCTNGKRCRKWVVVWRIMCMAVSW